MERYSKALEICLSTREFDGLLVIMVPQDLTPPEEVAAALVKLAKRKRIPILLRGWVASVWSRPSKSSMRRTSLPTRLRSGRGACLHVHGGIYPQPGAALPGTPKLSTDLYFNRDQVFRTIYECFDQEIELLSELQSKEILEAYGIPVNPTVLATSVEEAVSKAFELEGPLVMKLVSPDIPHKIRCRRYPARPAQREEDIRAAYANIIGGAKAYNPEAVITGVSLQPFIANPDF